MPYETKEEILKLGVIDPEFDAFCKANPLPPARYDDVQVFKDGAKARWEMLFKVLGQPPPSIKQTPMTYPTRDGQTVNAKLYQPTTPPENGSPLVVLFHGGGFTVGMPESEEQLARNLVLAFGATCISAGYRLAPEFPFPYAINDSWDALQWAAANGQSWGADTKAGFIVGGTSAGGNISAVLAHKARDENLSPPLTGQYLAIPAVCPESQMPEKYKHLALSYEQNKFAPVLPQALIDLFMSAYAPDDTDAENYSILNHPKGHKGLPNAFFQIDGLDPLRDEALIYEKVLREECNIPTKLFVYPGLPHGHWAFFRTLDSAKKFREEQMVGFSWLLGREAKVIDVNVGASDA